MEFDRALIVRPEWLEMILDGFKPWEMRSRRVSIRGVIGLIEAGSGLIRGQANLIDSLEPLSVAEFRKNVNKHKIPYRGCEHLAEKWNFPWVLDNAKRFETPIRYRHPKGAVTWVRITPGILIDATLG